MDAENPTKLLIGSQRPSLGDVDQCYHATTLTAWSQALSCEIVIVVTCKRWGCRWCGEQKAKQLAAKAAEAKPNKLITLTVNPSLHDDPRKAFEATAKKVTTLSGKIRRTHGAFEYMRVLELTKKGWPHYHLVARSPYIPHHWLSEEWDRLTGAPIVDIRHIKDTRETYWYVVKYLSKQKYCDWTDRRVTVTRRYAPTKQTPRSNALDLIDQRRENMPPQDYLRWQFPDTVWTRLGPLVFALNPRQQDQNGNESEPSVPSEHHRDRPHLGPSKQDP